MNKNDFTKIAKRIIHKESTLKKPQIIHPGRDWIIGLLIGLSIFIVSAAWSAKLYLEYRNISIGEIDEIEVVVYRKQMVVDALEGMSERKYKFDDLIQSSGSLPEPEKVVASTTDEMLGEKKDSMGEPEPIDFNGNEERKDVEENSQETEPDSLGPDLSEELIF